MRYLICFAVLALVAVIPLLSLAEPVASLKVTPGARPDEIKVEVWLSGCRGLRAYGFQFNFDTTQAALLSLADGSIFGAGTLSVQRQMETDLSRIEAAAVDRRLFSDDQKYFSAEGLVSGNGSLGTFIFSKKGGNPGFRISRIMVMETGELMKDIQIVVLDPTAAVLDQNYPNPFNPETQISFRLSLEGRVRLVVYNILGQEVRTLVDGVKPAGIYSVGWNGRDAMGRRVASGTYIYRLESNGRLIAARRMMLLK